MWYHKESNGDTRIFSPLLSRLPKAKPLEATG